MVVVSPRKATVRAVPRSRHPAWAQKMGAAVSAPGEKYQKKNCRELPAGFSNTVLVPTDVRNTTPMKATVSPHPMFLAAHRSASCAQPLQGRGIILLLFLAYIEPEISKVQPKIVKN